MKRRAHIVFLTCTLTSCHPTPSASAASAALEHMVFVPEGSFTGADGNQHKVPSFFMDRTEVTVEDYRECMRAGQCPGEVLWYSVFSPCRENERCPRRRVTRACNFHRAGRASYPMTCIGVGQAMNFCAWKGKRLPTEWEWEWAARGREEARRFPWGEAEATCEYAVMANPKTGRTGCRRGAAWPVGSRPEGASRDGVLDLAGNVQEFALGDRPNTATSRGGSFFEILPSQFEVARRYNPYPFSSTFPYSGSDPTVGFRCVASAP